MKNERMMWRLTIAASAILGLSACASSHPEPPPMVGGDRDAHGCIPSAGYSWCERSAQCERPWELAKREGFTLGAQAFASFCATTGP